MIDDSPSRLRECVDLVTTASQVDCLTSPDERFELLLRAEPAFELIQSVVVGEGSFDEGVHWPREATV